MDVLLILSSKLVSERFIWSDTEFLNSGKW